MRGFIPTITISTNASVNQDSGVSQDFTNPLTYVVTAENGTTENYVISVTIEADPTPAPDVTPPEISSYSLNGNSSDITINPINTPFDIILNASENVDWVSIKIEREADDSFYKMFFSNSSTCVDETNICTRTWDGLLSSGGLLENGVYRVRVRIEDEAGNKNYEPTEYYLPSVINVNTSL